MNKGKVSRISNLNKVVNVQGNDLHEYEVEFNDGYVGYLLSKNANMPPFKVGDEIDYTIKDPTNKRIKYERPQSPPPQSTRNVSAPANNTVPPAKNYDSGSNEKKKYARDVATYAARYGSDIEIAIIGKEGGGFNKQRFSDTVDAICLKIVESMKELYASFENKKH
jgi:hypothetical protein